MDLEQAGEQDAQNAGDENAQKGAGDGGQAPPVKAVDQGDNEDGQRQGDGQSHINRVPAPEVQGDQQLPDHQHGEDKGEYRPQPRRSGEEEQQKDEQPGQKQLPGCAVVVDHGDTEDLVPLVADADQRLVPGGKDLVLLQGAVQSVFALRGPPLKGTGQDFQLTALFPGADQAGVHHRGLVGGEDQSRPDVRFLKDQVFLKSGGEEKEYEGEQRAAPDGSTGGDRDTG